MDIIGKARKLERKIARSLDAAGVGLAGKSDTAPAAPRLKLTVLAGKAARRTQVFSGGRIDIGRRSEVLDAKQRVVRTNHVAFDEGPDENRSVSRQHAHVTFHPATAEYRLQDD